MPRPSVRCKGGAGLQVEVDGVSGMHVVSS